MPYTGPNDPGLPENVRTLATEKRRQWVAVWNTSYADCLEDRSNSDTCEQMAFRLANGVVDDSDTETEAEGEAMADMTGAVMIDTGTDNEPDAVSETLTPEAEAAPPDEDMQEAATLKSQVLRLMRNIESLLDLRNVPDSLRKEVEDVRNELRKRWADLSDEANGTGGNEEGRMGESITIRIDDQRVPISDTIDAWRALHNGSHSETHEGPDKEESSESEQWAIEGNLVEAAIMQRTAPPQGQSAGGVWMSLQLMEPGAGNQRDKHYYPAPMLRENAKKFVGAKMFATNHNTDEKTIRNWVSTIHNVKGFSSTGAPIMEVYVHEPNFAQGVRNLAAAGKLKELPCSIHANGLIKPATIDGCAYRVVQEITEVESVDWVSRAGAGGHALDLREHDGGSEMAEKEVKEGAEEEAREDEVVQEALNEKQGGADGQSLAVSTVLTELLNSGLPREAMGRLAEQEWTDAEALAAGIESEATYIKALTTGMTPPPQPTTRVIGNGKRSEVTESDTTATSPEAMAEQEMRIIRRQGLSPTRPSQAQEG